MYDCILVDTEEAQKTLNTLYKGQYPVHLDFYDYLNPESEKYLLDKNCKVLIYGRSVYDQLVFLDKAGIIHFGLRGYDYGTVKHLSHLTIGKCKIITCDHTNFMTKQNKYKFLYFLKLDGQFVPKYQLDKSLIVTCDEGIEALSKFSDHEDLGFDFESASFPTNYDFRPVGIGISNDYLGVYVDFRYYSSEKSRDDFFAFFKEWTKKREYYLWCYYASFEVNALRFMYHDFYHIEDVLALLKCDNTAGNLKTNAQHYLNIPSWDDEVDEFNNMMESLFKDFPTYESYKNVDITQLDDKQQLRLEGYKKFIIEKNYDERILKEYWGYEFAVTPHEIIGKYCILDSYYTLQLMKVIDRQNHYIKTR